MLCVDCGAFFDSRSEKWRKKYLELKTEAVHKLKANAQTSELPQFRDFKLDLEKFRMALDSRSNSMLPCPWYKEDLSWIPTALGQRD